MITVGPTKCDEAEQASADSSPLSPRPPAPLTQGNPGFHCTLLHHEPEHHILTSEDLQKHTAMDDYDSTEKGVQNNLHGLPGLASFIAQDPDQETQILRKFDDLTARTLLHMQSELLHLRQELSNVERAGAGSANLTLCIRNPQFLEKRAVERDGDERKLLMLLKSIEAKLEKYRKQYRAA